MEKKSHLHGSKENERRAAPASSNCLAKLAWLCDMTNIFHKNGVFF
jgi:hypothetical protein